MKNCKQFHLWINNSPPTTLARFQMLPANSRNGFKLHCTIGAWKNIGKTTKQKLVISLLIYWERMRGSNTPSIVEQWNLWAESKHNTLIHHTWECKFRETWNCNCEGVLKCAAWKTQCFCLINSQTLLLCINMYNVHWYLKVHIHEYISCRPDDFGSWWANILQPFICVLMESETI